MSDTDRDISKAIAAAAQPLNGSGEDFDGLMKAVGDARLVLLGEASHGTHEFYRARAQITQQLVTEKGFTAVIVEADWPDAYQVNRYVRGCDNGTADQALGGFERFPQWMWRNRDVVELVEWLRLHNKAIPRGQLKTGFYGMDLYSLFESADAVLAYLDKADPQAAKQARERYACFERFDDDPQKYGLAAGYRNDSCEKKAVAQLIELQRRRGELAKRDGLAAEDEYFFAEQNARLVQNAEAYYREMFAGRIDTWNLRDTHMVDTIEALLKHLDRTRDGRTKAVVWAHNSHLGDARATQMGDGGEVNVGSLSRQRWGRSTDGGEVFNVGFTTHAGTVTAADDWGGPATTMRVNPSLDNSYERLMHEASAAANLPAFLTIFGRAPRVRELLKPRRLERAIGVIYRPRTERMSHYFTASLSDQFDAVIHFDTTTAVMPLERQAAFDLEHAETFPSGV